MLQAGQAVVRGEELHQGTGLLLVFLYNSEKKRKLCFFVAYKQRKVRKKYAFQHLRNSEEKAKIVLFSAYTTVKRKEHMQRCCCCKLKQRNLGKHKGSQNNPERLDLRVLEHPAPHTTLTCTVTTVVMEYA